MLEGGAARCRRGGGAGRSKCSRVQLVLVDGGGWWWVLVGAVGCSWMELDGGGTKGQEN